MKLSPFIYRLWGLEKNLRALSPLKALGLGEIPSLPSISEVQNTKHDLYFLVWPIDTFPLLWGENPQKKTASFSSHFPNLSSHSLIFSTYSFILSTYFLKFSRPRFGLEENAPSAMPKAEIWMVSRSFRRNLYILVTIKWCGVFIGCTLHWDGKVLQYGVHKCFFLDINFWMPCWYRLF